MMENHFFEDPTKVVQYPTESPKKKMLDIALGTFIVSDIQPVSIVESPEFALFCSMMDAKYRLPTRDNLWGVISSMEQSICEVRASVHYLFTMRTSNMAVYFIGRRLPRPCQLPVALDSKPIYGVR